MTTSRISDTGVTAVHAHPGRARLIIATMLAVLSVVVFIPALIDPVEGSIPVVLGGILLLATWLIGRVPMPPLAWIAWAGTFVSGAVTLAIVGIWPELTVGVRGLGPFSLPPQLKRGRVYELNEAEVKGLMRELDKLIKPAETPGDSA